MGGAHASTNYLLTVSLYRIQLLVFQSHVSDSGAMELCTVISRRPLHINNANLALPMLHFNFRLTFFLFADYQPIPAN